MTDSPGAEAAGSAGHLHAPVDHVGATPMAFPIPTVPLARFVEVLGHQFRMPELLGEALTHRSWCAENAGYASNERLEFLGDSVLGLVVTDEIYALLPDAGEGQLSRIRAAVVCAAALAEMAADLGLGEVLLLGKGERTSGGRERPSILADAMEAVIGAVYLDGGIDVAAEIVGRLVGPRLETAGAPDPKSQLHELAARRGHGNVAYEITERGPEHDKTFEARAVVNGTPMGSGIGRSKKFAEQAAARATWTQLESQAGDLPAREEARHG